MDGLNMLDPYYLLLLAATTAAFGAIGVSIYIWLRVLHTLYTKFVRRKRFKEG